MSDYLWDKSGAPDAEVEDLEELLQGLRYQPRELEFPELPAPVPLATRRRYWPSLAAAAALVLMALAGLWTVLHRNRVGVSHPPTLAQANAAQAQPPRSTAETTSSNAANSIEPLETVEKQAGTKAEQPRRQALRRAVLKSRPQPSGPNMFEATPERQEVAAVGPQRRPQEQQQQEAEGIRAKEELMLALQVASAKLNHAQRKAQGAAPVTGPASKPAAPATNPWNKSR